MIVLGKQSVTAILEALNRRLFIERLLKHPTPQGHPAMTSPLSFEELHRRKVAGYYDPYRGIRALLPAFASS